MSCNICIEKFNKSSRVIVSCVYCEFTSCSSCCKRYILGTFETAHCMNCKKEWDRNILVKNFSMSFVDNVYKKHYENILFNKEVLLFPATQVYIEKETKKEELFNKIKKESLDLIYFQNLLEMLRNDNLKLKNEIFLYSNSNDRDIERKKSYLVAEYNDNIKRGEEYLRQYNEIFLKRNVLKIEYDALFTSCNKSTFIKKCSFTDCRGFLSSQWKCGLCENYTCKDCHVIKGLDKNCEHVCNKDVVETIKLLAKDTKECPNCGTGIFKTEGCDQMYCIECHTAFSWNTGKIETGAIHNPHYYEWMRKNGNDRNLNDIQCGREIDQVFIINLLRLLQHKNYHIYDKLFQDICVSVVHMRAVELPKYNLDVVNNNLNLRILLLKNSVSEDEFKKNIYKREKDLQKRRSIANVIAMYINCMTDIMYRVYDDINIDEKNIYPNGTSKMQGFMREFKQLKLYTEECLGDIAKVYKSKPVKLFNESLWSF